MKLRALGAIALAGALLVACGTERPTEAARPTVLVVGDSNVFQAYDEIRAALLDIDVVPNIYGVPGYGVAKDAEFWQRELPQRLALNPAVVVVTLGTNDTGTQAVVDAVPAAIDGMMRTLGDRPVVWFTHIDRRPGVAEPSNGERVNEAIRAAADRWPNLTIVDFTEEIEDDPALLGVDKLHFSAEGRRVYAEAIADAAEDQL